MELMSKKIFTTTKQHYFFFCKYLLLFFIFPFLSLGRLFAISHITIANFHIYIIEVVLFLTAPMLLLRLKDVFSLPKTIRNATLIFFILACVYVVVAFPKYGVFVCRDIVFSGYVLFLPLFFLCDVNRKDFQLLAVLFVVANIFTLLLYRITTFRVETNLMVRYLTLETRGFNFGLYCGMIVAFFFCYLSRIKNKMVQIFIMILLSVNLYMLFMSAKRVVWVALFLLIVFAIVSMRKLFIKNFIKLLPVLLIVLAVLYFLDFRVVSFSHEKELVQRAQSSIELIKDAVISISHEKKVAKVPPEEKKNAQSFSIPDTGVTSKALNERFFRLYKGKRKSLKGYRGVILDNLWWRLNIWTQAIDFGLRSPIFGRGFGVFPEYWTWTSDTLKKAAVKPGLRTDSGYIPAHNHLITVFYKMGMLGLILFIYINVEVLRLAFRGLKRIKDDDLRCLLFGSIGSLVHWHFMAFFFNVIDSPPTNIFLWIIMAVILSIVRIAEKDSEKA